MFVRSGWREADQGTVAQTPLLPHSSCCNACVHCRSSYKPLAQFSLTTYQCIHAFAAKHPDQNRVRSLFIAFRAPPRVLVPVHNNRIGVAYQIPPQRASPASSAPRFRVDRRCSSPACRAPPQKQRKWSTPLPMPQSWW